MQDRVVASHRPRSWGGQSRHLGNDGTCKDNVASPVVERARVHRRRSHLDTSLDGEAIVAAHPRVGRNRVSRQGGLPRRVGDHAKRRGMAMHPSKPRRRPCRSRVVSPNGKQDPPGIEGVGGRQGSTERPRRWAATLGDTLTRPYKRGRDKDGECYCHQHGSSSARAGARQSTKRTLPRGSHTWCMRRTSPTPITPSKDCTHGARPGRHGGQRTTQHLDRQLGIWCNNRRKREANPADGLRP